MGEDELEEVEHLLVVGLEQRSELPFGEAAQPRIVAEEREQSAQPHVAGAVEDLLADIEGGDHLGDLSG
ncbi:Uncharacterised protein [Mycobacteroides abscessus subsp. abscessus]|nr:Uncharacterised protein [Mycobacteroides abscessus subsp. abscessus]